LTVAPRRDHSQRRRTRASQEVEVDVDEIDPRMNRSGPELGPLLREIVDDSEELVRQQLRLIRSELREEWVQAQGAALALGAGAGLIATGGIFSAVALVHALHRTTRLSLGGSYALVGGMLGVAGAGLLAVGRERAERVRLPPPQSMEAFRENLAWLKEQVG